MENPVIILGSGGLEWTALDIFKKNNVVVYGILTDNEKQFGTEMDDVPVLGNVDDDGFLKLIGKKCEAFVATDDTKLKRNLVQMLNDRRHVMPVNAIHPQVSIGIVSEMGHGNFIGDGVKIGANSKIGHHNIFNPGSIIEHNAVIGDFVQIGAGAIIGAGITIEEGAFVGPGAVLVPGLTIGKNARIGAGSVVIANVEAKSTVFGNPAAKIK